MNWCKQGRFGRFIVVFLASLLLFYGITYAYIQNKSELERVQMEQLVTNRTIKINDVITKLLYKTQTLSALVIQNNGEIKDFERVAATIIDDPAIKNLILAPNGVVSHIYPLEGNEKAIHLDFFSEGSGNKEAVAAKESGQLVLGGPFDLIQGGQALVGRMPVHLGSGENKTFWGLVSVTLNYPQALDGAELEQLGSQGFAYEIWRVSPDTGQRQVIASSNHKYSKNALYVESPMTILNAQWYFRLAPINNWYEYPETWILVMVGLLISFLLATLVLHNSDLKYMKTELEELSYIEPLTSILNRRGTFKEIEALILEQNKEFILCYLDLNRFKSINDIYGHAMGDRVLSCFTSLVCEQINTHHIFGRIGGDEFIIVFKPPVIREEVDRFFADIRKKCKQWSVEIGLEYSCNIEISFSIGMAEYPNDANTLDGLVSFADNAMYIEKNRAKVQSDTIN